MQPAYLFVWSDPLEVTGGSGRKSVVLHQMAGEGYYIEPLSDLSIYLGDTIEKARLLSVSY
jgi:hypothetical protein